MPLVKKIADLGRSLAHAARLARGLGRSALEGLRQPASRRRALIIVAGILMGTYALSVFGYVVATPDIGLRCAFTPVVNHVYTDFLYTPEGKAPTDLRGYTVVQIGRYHINTWPEVLRAPLELLREPPQAEGIDTLANPEWTYVRADDKDWVRVQLRRPDDGSLVSAWCWIGTAPLESLLPSVLWFFLKTGLFLVAAIVFWKRPDDISARQFFFLSILTFGAYMGGYQWSRIVTQLTAAGEDRLRALRNKPRISAVARWAHLLELRIELAEDFDQIGLRGHDGVDVLIDARHFIEPGAEQLDAALGEQLLGRAPGEGLHRLGAAHHAARAV